LRLWCGDLRRFLCRADLQVRHAADFRMPLAERLTIETVGEFFIIGDVGLA